MVGTRSPSKYTCMDHTIFLKVIPAAPNGHSTVYRLFGEQALMIGSTQSPCDPINLTNTTPPYGSPPKDKHMNV